jgi:hypothetical protein
VAVTSRAHRLPAFCFTPKLTHPRPLFVTRHIDGCNIGQALAARTQAHELRQHSLRVCEGAMQAILPTSSTPDEFRRSGGGKTAAEASRQDLDGAGPAAMPDLEIKREKTTTASPSLAHPIQLADNNEGGGSCNGLHNAVGTGDCGRSTPPGSGAHPTAAASAADSPAENFTAAQAGAALAEVASGGQGHGCVVNSPDTTNTTDNMATYVSRAPHLPLPTPAVNVNLMLENARLRDEVEALRMCVKLHPVLRRRDVWWPRRCIVVPCLSRRAPPHWL